MNIKCKNGNITVECGGLYWLLSIVFIILKVCHVIELPWVWVLAWIWIPLAGLVITLIGFLIYDRTLKNKN